MMTDTEQVYALYVQANPVPYPELLPLTRAEAELLTHERSRDMDTRQRIKVRPNPQTAPRRRLVFGLAAIVVIAAVATGVFLIGGGGDNPVAAADATPEIVFDGESCRYHGPTLIETGTATYTLVNTSRQPVTAAVFSMSVSQLNAELERAPLGTDMDLTEFDPMPPGSMTFSIQAEPGAESAGTVTLTAGPQVIDCLTYERPSDVAPNHVWRAQTRVDVVAP